MASTLLASTSTPHTSWPLAARHAAVTVPTYPSPNTATFMLPPGGTRRYRWLWSQETGVRYLLSAPQGQGWQTPAGGMPINTRVSKLQCQTSLHVPGRREFG